MAVVGVLSLILALVVGIWRCCLVDGGGVRYDGQFCRCFSHTQYHEHSDPS